MTAPRREVAIARYRRLAPHYDAATRRIEAVRAEAVALLDPRPGETVLDVGCGTGNSFDLVERRIGSSGHLIGIEPSPDMMARARERVARHGWRNVTLIESAAEEVVVPGRADAVLFVYTQDVLQSRRALACVFAHARRGARVACAGTKLFPWWLAPANLYLLLRVRSYVTTFRGLARPWELLREFVPNLEMKPVLLGRSYVARGTHERPAGE